MRTYDLQKKWHPGQENLADSQSKHHTGTSHQAIRSWYLHENNSSQVLPHAAKPSSTLKGCVLGFPPKGMHVTYSYLESHYNSRALNSCLIPVFIEHLQIISY